MRHEVACISVSKRAASEKVYQSAHASLHADSFCMSLHAWATVCAAVNGWHFCILFWHHACWGGAARGSMHECPCMLRCAAATGRRLLPEARNVLVPFLHANPTRAVASRVYSLCVCMLAEV